jgi:hypothetical protein
MDKFCKCVNNTGSDVQHLPFETSPFFLSADLIIHYVHVESKSIIVNTLFYGAYKIVRSPYYMAIHYDIIRYYTIKYNTIQYIFCVQNYIYS